MPDKGMICMGIIRAEKLGFDYVEYREEDERRR
jgi:hypothetical protein